MEQFFKVQNLRSWRTKIFRVNQSSFLPNVLLIFLTTVAIPSIFIAFAFNFKNPYFRDCSLISLRFLKFSYHLENIDIAMYTYVPMLSSTDNFLVNSS